MGTMGNTSAALHGMEMLSYRYLDPLLSQTVNGRSSGMRTTTGRASSNNTRLVKASGLSTTRRSTRRKKGSTRSSNLRLRGTLPKKVSRGNFSAHSRDLWICVELMYPNTCWMVVLHVICYDMYKYTKMSMVLATHEC